MRLGGVAAYLVEVHQRQDVAAAVVWAKQQGLPVLMIGDGSNIVWRDEGFAGLIIVNKIMGIEVFDEDETNTYLTIGGGENWDYVVLRSVEAGLTGIEALSLIPGTTGATPVQNVGAYGQEIAQTLVSIEAYDTISDQFATIPNMDCEFGYRTSRFKAKDHGRYLITAITLHLTKGNPQPPFYAALQRHLDENGIRAFTPQTIREAVITIRRSKLPDPAVVANNGSFFANPIIDEAHFFDIQTNYPDAPHWSMDDGRVKVPAAWLVEQAGFKDVHDAETGMGTWPAQALVLVNEKATSTADLLKFKQRIINTVQQMFSITLEQEPELLP